MMIQLFSMS